MKKLFTVSCLLKHSLFLFFSLLLLASCRKEKGPDIDPTKSGEFGISAITIALKDENLTWTRPKRKPLPPLPTLHAHSMLPSPP